MLILWKAKYAYRSIAQFVKHVTENSKDHLEACPFPELHHHEESTPSSHPSSAEPTSNGSLSTPSNERDYLSPGTQEEPHHLTPTIGTPTNSSGVNLYKENAEATRVEIGNGNLAVQESQQSQGSNDSEVVTMIRERVDVSGHVRTMEPKEEIETLRIPPQQLGLIKEDPVRRWLNGQELWDKKFKRTAHKVQERRKHYEAKAAKLIEHAREQGLILKHEANDGLVRRSSTASRRSARSTGMIVHERRWGIN